MQREILSTSGCYGGGNAFASSSSSSPFVSQCYYGYDFSSNLFPPNPSMLNRDENHSVSNASVPASCSPQLNSSLQLNQELMARHNVLISRLQEVLKQAHALRQENINLRMVNAELTNQFNRLINAASFLSYNNENTNININNSDVDTIVEGLRKLCDEAGEQERENHAPRLDDLAAAASVDGSPRDGSGGDGEVDRVLLPKSISVRSSGYLKAASEGDHGGNGGKVGNKGLNKGKSGNAAQRVYVPGGMEEEQPLEFEVYNQGMYKTELCNKWQQTGTCPYGENCQFAHGIEELRPVIRHPRYKTEVCRMVLNGDPCPYGHRCHFRHKLTDEEKLMRSINERSLKPLNR